MDNHCENCKSQAELRACGGSDETFRLLCAECAAGRDLCDRQRAIRGLAFHRGQLDQAIAINNYVAVHRLNVEIAEQRVLHYQECDCAECAAVEVSCG